MNLTHSHLTFFQINVEIRQFNRCQYFIQVLIARALETPRTTGCQTDAEVGISHSVRVHKEGERLRLAVESEKSGA